MESPGRNLERVARMYKRNSEAAEALGASYERLCYLCDQLGRETPHTRRRRLPQEERECREAGAKSSDGRRKTSGELPKRCRERSNSTECSGQEGVKPRYLLHEMAGQDSGPRCCRLERACTEGAVTEDTVYALIELGVVGPSMDGPFGRVILLVSEKTQRKMISCGDGTWVER